VGSGREASFCSVEERMVKYDVGDGDGADSDVAPEMCFARNTDIGYGVGPDLALCGRVTLCVI